MAAHTGLDSAIAVVVRGRRPIGTRPTSQPKSASQPKRAPPQSLTQSRSRSRLRSKAPLNLNRSLSRGQAMDLSNLTGPKEFCGAVVCVGNHKNERDI